MKRYMNSRMNSSGNSRISKKLRKSNPRAFSKILKKSVDDNNDVIRKELYDRIGTRVYFSGEMEAVGSLVKAPINLIVTDVYIDGEYIDHIWIKLNRKDWKKLWFKAHKMERVYMTGVVTRYSGKGHSTKIGVKDVELRRTL